MFLLDWRAKLYVTTSDVCKCMKLHLLPEIPTFAFENTLSLPAPEMQQILNNGTLFKFIQFSSERKIFDFSPYISKNLTGSKFCIGEKNVKS